jgi:hypothetical protein
LKSYNFPGITKMLLKIEKKHYHNSNRVTPGSLVLTCTALILTVVSIGYADVIGNWETSSGDGWIDKENSLSIANAANADTYSFLSTTGATLGDYSLKVTPPAEWKQCLRINLQSKAGAMADFLAHNKFKIDVTYNSADWPADTNYAEIYELSINAQGLDPTWQDIGGGHSPDGNHGVVFTDTLNPSVPGALPLTNAGTPGTTITGTFIWDYSGIKSQIPASPTFIEFIFALNSDKLGAYYFDNARLEGLTNSPKAQEPCPSDNGKHVSTTPTLSWTAGCFVQDTNCHNVYLGTDYNAVSDANTSSTDIFLGTVTDPCYPIITELNGVDYYWRVDEVNDANASSPWEGDVWHFTTTNAPPVVPPARLHVEGNKIKDPNGDTVVLRGLSMNDLGATYYYYGVETLIDRITNTSDTNGNSPGWYPNILRIPVCPHDSALYGYSPLTFEPNFDPNDANDSNTINNEEFYTLLRTAVDYCAEKQLYAIIDWHHMANTYDKVAETNVFWGYIAPRCANDTHVLFELFNEPENPGATEDLRWESCRDDMQTWVDIIRASAPHNLILVGSPQYDQILGPIVYNPIVDDNVVYVCHLYPYHWLSGSHDWYINHITTCAEQYPVICTEWGFTDDSDYYSSDGSNHYFEGNITNYGQPLKDFFEEYGISFTAWVLSNSDGWNPPMFYSNWTLRCGDGEMGCFTKDWLYQGNYARTTAITINKCKVKAGKTQGADDNDITNIKDKFTASGTFTHITPDFNLVDSLVINITSLKTDSNLIYTKTIPFSMSQIVKGNYKYSYKIPKGGAGTITSLKLNFNKNTFAIKTKNIDLTGLGASLQLDIIMSPYTLTGTAAETIINGSKKLIPTRLMRMFEDTLVVTKAKVRHSATALSDSLSVKGEIAVANIINDDMEEPNLVTVDVNVVWGDHTFTIPAGRFAAAKTGHSYKCGKVLMDVNDCNTGLVSAKFDLDKCKFKVSVKNADGLDAGLDDNIVSFGINFGDDYFNQPAEVNVVTGRSY